MMLLMILAALLNVSSRPAGLPPLSSWSVSHHSVSHILLTSKHAGPAS